MQVAVNLNRLDRHFGGKFRPTLDIARMADAKGVDQIVINDHIALAPAGFHSYPHGAFPNKPDAFMAEATTVLSALAAVTERARLSMSVLIAPARSAVLLAKQLSMIDVISEGRLDAGLGAGWHREEFDAAERPFEGRFGYLEEQIEVCRVLWSSAPANFEGNRVRFKDLFVTPLPVQGRNLPIWLGISATDLGVRRLVRLADGWTTPPTPDVGKLAADIARVKEALRAAGRDPETFPIRSQLRPVRRADGSVDLDASLAGAQILADAGVTMVMLTIHYFCDGADDVESVIGGALSLKSIVARRPF